MKIYMLTESFGLKSFGVAQVVLQITQRCFVDDKKLVTAYAFDDNDVENQKYGWVVIGEQWMVAYKMIAETGKLKHGG